MSDMSCVFCSKTLVHDSSFCGFCGTSVVAKITSIVMIDAHIRENQRKKDEAEKREKLKREKEISRKEAENIARVNEAGAMLDRMQQVAASTRHHEMAVDLQEARTHIQKLLEEGRIPASESESLLARANKIEAQSKHHTLLEKRKGFYRSIVTSKLFWILSILTLPVSLLWIIPILVIAKNKGVWK
jgi:hypothetical protein